jgi:hypothetical protein
MTWQALLSLLDHAPIVALAAGDRHSGSIATSVHALSER